MSGSDCCATQQTKQVQHSRKSTANMCSNCNVFLRPWSAFSALYLLSRHLANPYLGPPARRPSSSALSSRRRRVVVAPWLHRRRAVVASSSRRRRAVVAPSSRSRRAVVASSSRRRRAVVAPSSRRRRAVVAPSRRRRFVPSPPPSCPLENLLTQLLTFDKLLVYFQIDY